MKKTKDIRRNKKGFVSLLRPMYAITALNANMSVRTVMEQPMPPRYASPIVEMSKQYMALKKALSVASIATETLSKLHEINRSEMLRRFRETGRYTAKRRKH